MVAVMGNEDLRLMGESPESGAMDDAVAVALKFRARRRGGLGDEPAAATRRDPPRMERAARKYAEDLHEAQFGAALVAILDRATYVPYCKSRQGSCIARPLRSPSETLHVPRFS